MQVLDEQKLQQVDSLWKEFETPEKANKVWVFFVNIIFPHFFFSEIPVMIKYFMTEPQILFIPTLNLEISGNFKMVKRTGKVFGIIKMISQRNM